MRAPGAPLADGGMLPSADVGGEVSLALNHEVGREGGGNDCPGWLERLPLENNSENGMNKITPDRIWKMERAMQKAQRKRKEEKRVEERDI